MGSNLARVLPHVNTNELVSVAAKYSKKIGAVVGQAHWSNGLTAIKIITPHGAQVLISIIVPKVTSKGQRNEVIHDLSKLGFKQALIGVATGTSRSNVSRILRK